MLSKNPQQNITPLELTSKFCHTPAILVSHALRNAKKPGAEAIYVALRDLVRYNYTTDPKEYTRCIQLLKKLYPTQEYTLTKLIKLIGAVEPLTLETAIKEHDYWQKTPPDSKDLIKAIYRITGLEKTRKLIYDKHPAL